MVGGGDLDDSRVGEGGLLEGGEELFGQEEVREVVRHEAEVESFGLRIWLCYGGEDSENEEQRLLTLLAMSIS